MALGWERAHSFPQLQTGSLQGVTESGEAFGNLPQLTNNFWRLFGNNVEKCATIAYTVRIQIS